MSVSTIQSAPMLLTEHDIRAFLREPVTLRHYLRSFYLSAFFMVLIAVGSYGFLNYSALLRLYTDEPVVAAEPQPTPVQTALAAKAAPTAAPSPTIPQNTLSFGSLNISAPIAWDTLFDEKIIQGKLQNGVVHFQGTAKPGQKGMVVITGHSSNYPWAKGQYNNVFAPLHKARLGQEIVANYNDHEYVYKVTKIYQVTPQELSVLQAGDKDGLRLITCTPIGTSLRRLVIEAEQTSPSTADNTAFTHTMFSGSVPDGR